MKKTKRIKLYLKIPIVMIAFAIGWVLYCIGDSKPCSKKTPQRNLK